MRTDSNAKITVFQPIQTGKKIPDAIYLPAAACKAAAFSAFLPDVFSDSRVKTK